MPKKNPLVFNVFLDPSFINGQNNGEYFVDLPFLDNNQLVDIAKFIKKVESGEALAGKNKESWLLDDLSEAKDSALYKDLCYWHYHVGPYSSQQSITSMTHGLGRNLNGLTSAAVIHYQKKIETKEVVIVGFSPKHIPFPSSDAGNNPLFEDEDD